MKLKQINSVVIGLLLVAASFVGSLAFPAASQAYKCPGKDSNNLDYVYENGRCYQQVYSVTPRTTSGQCPSNSQVSSDGRCVIRSLKSDGAPAPVNDDGSAVKNWRCSDSGARYNGRDCVVTVPCIGVQTICEEKRGHQIPNDEEVARKAAKDGFIADCKNKGYTQERCAAMATNIENNCAEDRDTSTEVTKCLSDAGKTLQTSSPNDPGNTACNQHGGWSATGKCADGTTPGVDTGTGDGDANSCGKAKTNLISCEGEGVQALGSVLKQVITILSVLIGIVAVGGIAYASILYAGSTDNASQKQQAITTIRNIVIGIVVYGFMIAIINWLVPGGIIG